MLILCHFCLKYNLVLCKVELHKDEFYVMTMLDLSINNELRSSAALDFISTRFIQTQQHQVHS